eukprot:jgi/Mesvir1/22778/Mv14167-RA.2
MTSSAPGLLPAACDLGACAYPPSANWYGAHITDWCPSTRLFAYAARNAVVLLLPEEKKFQAILAGHSNRVTAVAFWHTGPSWVCSCHEQGRLLLFSASADRSVRVWDGSGVTPPLILKGHKVEVSAICTSRLGAFSAASGDASGKLLVWSGLSHAKLAAVTPATFSVGSSPIVCLAPSPIKAAELVVGSEDGSIKVVNALSGDVLQSLTSHEGGVQCLTWLPPMGISSGKAYPTTYTEAAAVDQPPWVGGDPADSTQSEEAAPRVSLLASAGKDRKIVVWRSSIATASSSGINSSRRPALSVEGGPSGADAGSTGPQPNNFPSPVSASISIAASDAAYGKLFWATIPFPGGRAAASQARKERSWAALAWLLPPSVGECFPLQLLCSAQLGQLFSFELKGVSMTAPPPAIRVPSPHSRMVFSINPLLRAAPGLGVSAFASPGHGLLATAQPTKEDVSTHGAVSKRAQVFATDAVITTSMDRLLVVLDRKGAPKDDLLTPRWSAQGLGGVVFCLAVNPLDPNQVAVACGDGTIRLWRVNHKTNPFHSKILWEGIQGKVTVVAWHPLDGSLLAYGTDEGFIGLYYSDKEVCLTHKVPAHKESVHSLSWRLVETQATACAATSPSPLLAAPLATATSADGPHAPSPASQLMVGPVLTQGEASQVVGETTVPPAPSLVHAVLYSVGRDGVALEWAAHLDAFASGHHGAAPPGDERAVTAAPGGQACSATSSATSNVNGSTSSNAVMKRMMGGGGASIAARWADASGGVASSGGADGSGQSGGGGRDEGPLVSGMPASGTEGMAATLRPGAMAGDASSEGSPQEGAVGSGGGVRQCTELRWRAGRQHNKRTLVAAGFSDGSVEVYHAASRMAAHATPRDTDGAAPGNTPLAGETGGDRGTGGGTLGGASTDRWLPMGGGVDMGAGSASVAGASSSRVAAAPAELPWVCVARFWGHSKRVNRLRWCRGGPTASKPHKEDGRTGSWVDHALASVAEDGSIRVYDVGAALRGVAADPHGLTTGAGLSGPTAQGVAGTGTPVPWGTSARVLTGHKKQIISIEWHPQDAGLLTSCGSDGSVMVWDVRPDPAACLASCDALHQGRVMALAWSPVSPSVVLSGGDDQCVRAWEFTAPSKSRGTKGAGAGVGGSARSGAAERQAHKAGQGVAADSGNVQAEPMSSETAHEGAPTLSNSASKEMPAGQGDVGREAPQTNVPQPLTSGDSRAGPSPREASAGVPVAEGVVAHTSAAVPPVSMAPAMGDVHASAGGPADHAALSGVRGEEADTSAGVASTSGAPTPMATAGVVAVDAPAAGNAAADALRNAVPNETAARRGAVSQAVTDAGAGASTEDGSSQPGGQAGHLAHTSAVVGSLPTVADAASGGSQSQPPPPAPPSSSASSKRKKKGGAEGGRSLVPAPDPAVWLRGHAQAACLVATERMLAINQDSAWLARGGLGGRDDPSSTAGGGGVPSQGATIAGRSGLKATAAHGLGSLAVPGAAMDAVVDEERVLREEGAAGGDAGGAGAGAGRVSLMRAATLAMWRGDISGVLAALAHEGFATNAGEQAGGVATGGSTGLLTGDWVSLSVCAGRDVWERVVRAYARQLEAAGEVHMAALQLLSLQDAHGAVGVYHRGGLLRDAIALASIRLLPSDPLTRALHLEYAEEMDKAGHHEQAASSFLAAGAYSRALQSLSHRHDELSRGNASRLALMLLTARARQLQAPPPPYPSSAASHGQGLDVRAECDSFGQRTQATVGGEHLATEAWSAHGADGDAPFTDPLAVPWDAAALPSAVPPLAGSLPSTEWLDSFLERSLHVLLSNDSWAEAQCLVDKWRWAHAGTTAGSRHPKPYPMSSSLPQERPSSQSDAAAPRAPSSQPTSVPPMLPRGSAPAPPLPSRPLAHPGPSVRAVKGRGSLLLAACQLLASCEEFLGADASSHVGGGDEGDTLRELAAWVREAHPTATSCHEWMDQHTCQLRGVGRSGARSALPSRCKDDSDAANSMSRRSNGSSPSLLYPRPPARASSFTAGQAAPAGSTLHPERCLFAHLCRAWRGICTEDVTGDTWPLHAHGPQGVHRRQVAGEWGLSLTPFAQGAYGVLVRAGAAGDRPRQRLRGEMARRLCLSFLAHLIGRPTLALWHTISALSACHKRAAYGSLARMVQALHGTWPGWAGSADPAPSSAEGEASAGEMDAGHADPPSPLELELAKCRRCLDGFAAFGELHGLWSRHRCDNAAATTAGASNAPSSPMGRATAGGCQGLGVHKGDGTAGVAPTHLADTSALAASAAVAAQAQLLPAAASSVAAPSAATCEERRVLASVARLAPRLLLPAYGVHHATLTMQALLDLGAHFLADKLTGAEATRSWRQEGLAVDDGGGAAGGGWWKNEPAVLLVMMAERGDEEEATAGSAPAGVDGAATVMEAAHPVAQEGVPQHQEGQWDCGVRVSPASLNPSPLAFAATAAPATASTTSGAATARTDRAAPDGGAQASAPVFPARGDMLAVPCPPGIARLRVAAGGAAVVDAVSALGVLELYSTFLGQRLRDGALWGAGWGMRQQPARCACPARTGCQQGSGDGMAGNASGGGSTMSAPRSSDVDKASASMAGGAVGEGLVGVPSVQPAASMDAGAGRSPAHMAALDGSASGEGGADFGICRRLSAELARAAGQLSAAEGCPRVCLAALQQASTALASLPGLVMGQRRAGGNYPAEGGVGRDGGGHGACTAECVGVDSWMLAVPHHDAQDGWCPSGQVPSNDTDWQLLPFPSPLQSAAMMWDLLGACPHHATLERMRASPPVTGTSGKIALPWLTRVQPGGHAENVLATTSGPLGVGSSERAVEDGGGGMGGGRAGGGLPANRACLLQLVSKWGLHFATCDAQRACFMLPGRVSVSRRPREPGAGSPLGLIRGGDEGRGDKDAPVFSFAQEQRRLMLLQQQQQQQPPLSPQPGQSPQVVVAGTPLCVSVAAGLNDEADRSVLSPSPPPPALVEVRTPSSPLKPAAALGSREPGASDGIRASAVANVTATSSAPSLLAQDKAATEAFLGVVSACVDAGTHADAASPATLTLPHPANPSCGSPLVAQSGALHPSLGAIEANTSAQAALGAQRTADTDAAHARGGEEELLFRVATGGAAADGALRPGQQPQALWRSCQMTMVIFARKVLRVPEVGIHVVGVLLQAGEGQQEGEEEEGEEACMLPTWGAVQTQAIRDRLEIEVHDPWKVAKL